MLCAGGFPSAASDHPYSLKNSYQSSVNKILKVGSAVLIRVSPDGNQVNERVKLEELSASLLPDDKLPVHRPFFPELPCPAVQLPGGRVIVRAEDANHAHHVHPVFEDRREQFSRNLPHFGSLEMLHPLQFPGQNFL